MTEPAPTPDQIDALVRAAREAAEELYILTRMGTRRADPVRRYHALMEALQPFEESPPPRSSTADPR